MEETKDTQQMENTDIITPKAKPKAKVRDTGESKTLKLLSVKLQKLKKAEEDYNKCLDSLKKDKKDKKEETTKIKKPRAKKEPKPTPTNKGE